MAPINPPEHAIDDMPPPPAPEDPPTDADVACARKYVDDVATRYHIDHNISDQVLAQAEKYHLAIVMAHSGAPAAPEWFNAALTTALRPLQNSVNQMRREMRQEFGEVHRKLYTISRSVIQARNETRRDGVAVPYAEVPLMNGTFPSDLAPPLCKLSTLAAIEALSLDQACDLLRAWQAPIPEGTPEQQLRRAIGAVRSIVGVSARMPRRRN